MSLPGRFSIDPVSGVMVRCSTCGAAHIEIDQDGAPTSAAARCDSWAETHWRVHHLHSKMVEHDTFTRRVLGPEPAMVISEAADAQTERIEWARDRAAEVALADIEDDAR